jgi:hypothetical protein
MGLMSFSFVLFMLAPVARGQAATAADIQKILDQLAEQQKTILSLQTTLAEQQKRIDQLTGVTAAAAAPAAPSPAATPVVVAVAAAPAPAASTAAPAAQTAEVTRSVRDLMRNVGGFRLSGDMRLRFDLQSRAGNAVAAPLQNARERYRFRLNVDRDFFTSKDTERPLIRVHAQLATAPLNNPLTMDTDFTGVDMRAPISLSEAWVDFAPTKNLTFRAGRGPELFADNLQYVYDDDVRFNGFHEAYRMNGKNGSFLEIKAAQYILTNPNTPIVAAGSPYVNAGYRVGQRVPSAGLFDQGITVGGNLGKKWRHSWTGNYFLLREANQLSLASTAAGFPVLTSPEFGAVLTGPLPQTGNATTTPGGAIYNADRFRIIRGAFTLNYSGREILGHNVPARLFIQGTRNTGAKIERDGFAAGFTLGQVGRPGDILFQYAYMYKPANALVSQLTDDDVGTVTGVNLRAHALRLDFGIAKWVTFENRLYIQDPIAHNMPERNFYVPVQRGTNTTVRLQAQFNFTF